METLTQNFTHYSDLWFMGVEPIRINQRILSPPRLPFRQNHELSLFTHTFAYSFGNYPILYLYVISHTLFVSHIEQAYCTALIENLKTRYEKNEIETLSKA